MIRPSSPRGARPYLVSGMSLWNDFGGIHQSWNLRHGLPVTRNTGMWRCPCAYPPQGDLVPGVGVSLHSTAPAAWARP